MPSTSPTSQYHVLSRAPTLSTDEYVQQQLKDAIEALRLESYNITNLRQILDEINVDLSYPTVRIDKEEDTGTSSMLSYFISLIMDLMLYTFILIYGQMVMSSIIEEKNNRVLEIVVSSVNPSTLMMGKVLGIGLVAITQILILGRAYLGLHNVGLVPLVGTSLSSGAGVGVEANAELLAAVSQLSDLGYVASLMSCMLLYFVGGYLFYSAIYAAIGSAVDNIQDASQLSTIPTLPVIIALVASMSVMQNPGSSLAFWLSMIPFTSPMTMMSRIAFDVPIWGDNCVARHSLCLICRHDMAVGKNLSRRNIHVWQKAIVCGNNPLGQYK